MNRKFIISVFLILLSLSLMFAHLYQIEWVDNSHSVSFKPPENLFFSRDGNIKQTEIIKDRATMSIYGTGLNLYILSNFTYPHNYSDKTKINIFTSIVLYKGFNQSNKSNIIVKNNITGNSFFKNKGLNLYPGSYTICSSTVIDVENSNISQARSEANNLSTSLKGNSFVDMLAGTPVFIIYPLYSLLAVTFLSFVMVVLNFKKYRSI